jgi:hypothetical protein
MGREGPVEGKLDPPFDSLRFYVAAELAEMRGMGD